MNILKAIFVYFAFITICVSQSLKVSTKTSDYTIAPSDRDTIFVFTNVTKPLVKMTVPLENSNRTEFSTGSRVYGTSLTDSTVHIVGANGVEIISPNEAFRSAVYGSKWELIRLSRNLWLLQGDLYSLEMTAFKGDDVVIRAIVDTSATGPFTFKWYRNGTLIPGATNASLKLPNVQLANSGKYYAIVSNAKGTFTSETTNLVVK